MSAGSLNDVPTGLDPKVAALLDAIALALADADCRELEGGKAKRPAQEAERVEFISPAEVEDES